MNKTIVLTGPIGSGKTTLANYFEALGHRDVLVLNPSDILALSDYTKMYVVWLDIPEDIIMRRAFVRGDSPEKVAKQVMLDRTEFMVLDAANRYDLRIREVMPVERLYYLICDKRDMDIVSEMILKPVINHINDLMSQN